MKDLYFLKRNSLLMLIIVFFLSIPCLSYGYTFSEAIDVLKSHESVTSLAEKSKGLEEEGGVKGTWGDPMFKVAAKNFPKDSYKDNETPMTGVEFGVSQKIALTTKYGNIRDAYAQQGRAEQFGADDKVQDLIRSLWMILTDGRRLDEEINIIRENLSWVSKMLKVSKKLYANGKTSQQAVLDIQIRKSELEALLSNKEYETKEEMAKLSYLVGFNTSSLDKKTIPWRLISKKENSLDDAKEKKIEAFLKSKEKLLVASKLAFVPDVTFSIGYTKRSNIDDKGDFVSATVSFPLPFSGDKYHGHAKAVHERASAMKALANYKKFKSSETSRLSFEINKIEQELKILKDRTIKYAENSRTIASKSYSLGNSSYIELLQAELKLQNLRLKYIFLKSQLTKKVISLKYLVGEKLYE